MNSRDTALPFFVFFCFFVVLSHQDVASELQKVIDGYIKFANSSDEAYIHIEAEVSH